MYTVLLFSPWTFYMWPECLYSVFTCIPGYSYQRWLGSLSFASPCYMSDVRCLLVTSLLTLFFCFFGNNMHDWLLWCNFFFFFLQCTRSTSPQDPQGSPVSLVTQRDLSTAKPVPRQTFLSAAWSPLAWQHSGETVPLTSLTAETKNHLTKRRPWEMDLSIWILFLSSVTAPPQSLSS